MCEPQSPRSDHPQGELQAEGQGKVDLSPRLQLIRRAHETIRRSVADGWSFAQIAEALNVRQSDVAAVWHFKYIPNRGPRKVSTKQLTAMADFRNNKGKA